MVELIYRREEVEAAITGEPNKSAGSSSAFPSADGSAAAFDPADGRIHRACASSRVVLKPDKVTFEQTASVVWRA
jgi:hypothetical protein